MSNEIKEAIEQARAALMNAPEVGDVYDQQHSDTQVAAWLRLGELLK